MFQSVVTFILIALVILFFVRSLFTVLVHWALGRLDDEDLDLPASTLPIRGPSFLPRVYPPREPTE
jgi:hypothetical protein